MIDSLCSENLSLRYGFDDFLSIKSNIVKWNFVAKFIYWSLQRLYVRT